jgi:2'-5' RNA ligase|tara:strand:- start:12586 stop:13086 length:501 start_codon:yes stop_codon:yes gene_type:complete
MFAIWYLFDKDDTNYLFRIIKELAKKYYSPIFVPHITAYGLIDIDLKTLDKKVISVIKEMKSFTIEKKTISFSKDFWKTLFIEIESNEHFIKINNNLTEQFFQHTKYEFVPHVSLIYKNIKSYQSQFLVENLNIKKNFRIVGMGIQQFSENVEEWKIVRKYQFEGK